MTKFPSDYDDDTTLPFVNENIVEIGGIAINALRDVAFATEQEIGIGASGTCGSIAQRLGVFSNPDGSIKPSVITSLGLVTLPITGDQIAADAEILESKLRLDHRTSDLYNYIRDLSNDINTALGWMSISGIKLEPHLSGIIYRHTLDQIDVGDDPSHYLTNVFREYRNNSSLFTLMGDINNELLAHQFADGSPIDSRFIVTNNGSSFSANYAHTASGIFLNSSRFTTVPQTVEDLQTFADYIDNASIFLYGTRIQNLYSNGISKESRSSNLVAISQGKNIGQTIVDLTPAIAHLLNNGAAGSPVDDVNLGDDIIELVPTVNSPYTNSFEEQFALVKIGDIITINYGSAPPTPIEVSFVIKEKKYTPDGNPANRKFMVRIAGKNLYYSSDGYARIDKPLFNKNKYGVLAIAAANNGGLTTPSLIVGNPRSAMALGLGFNADTFDATHYNLYLALYPTGRPQDGYTILPAIDVTGNAGATPGKYNLEYIIEKTNDQFRAYGFNYRFIAFSYQGEMGIMLADSYNNAAFSILSAVIDGYGNYSLAGTISAFPNNVIGIFSTAPQVAPDPLGFGPTNANIASPAFQSAYISPEATLLPTKIFVPLARNNYYVNGLEKDKLAIYEDVYQSVDGYGDGYWAGFITDKFVYGSPGRVEVTYRVMEDLSASGLAAGKTLVIQSMGSGGLVDCGRFTIKNITFGCGIGSKSYTDITVYDAEHAVFGIPPATTADKNTYFAIYFSHDSVSFNKETSTDYQVLSASFKRHFEVYVDSLSKTFTHERGRIYIDGTSIQIDNSSYLRSDIDLAKLHIVKISPKLRGYQFNAVTKISLRITSFVSPDIYSGYLCRYDGPTLSTEDDYTRRGPTVSGRSGEITRFYDETGTDYIDIVFNIGDDITGIAAKIEAGTYPIIDFQLFPTLSLDNEMMLIGTCQLNDSINAASNLRDERQFGNVSEKELSTSAIDFISTPDKLLHANGVISGFDLVEATTSPLAPNPNTYGQIKLKGGKALVNGKVLYINNELVSIPPVTELYLGISYKIVWALCLNDKGEYVTLPLLDYNSSIPTPSNTFRNMSVYTQNPTQTYSIDANTFSDLVYYRKDLLVLYTVYSSVTTFSPLVMTIDCHDARRYVSEVDNNLPLRLNGSSDALIPFNSNFKTLNSLFNWVQNNSKYNGIVNIRNYTGNVTIGESSSVLKLGGTNANLIIDGENSSDLGFYSNQVILSSNLTVRNMILSFGNSSPIANVSIDSSAHDITIENCTINIYAYSLASAVLLFSSCNDITIKNCTIYFYVYTGSPVFSTTALIQVSNCSNFRFLNNTVNVSYSPTTSTNYVFYLANSPRTIIQDSTFTGGFLEFAEINDSSDSVKILNCVVNSTHNPASDPSYDTSNFVNSGRGLIHASVSYSLDDIEINQVVFNYNPQGTLSAYDRYSFINFELTTPNATINNLKITNCRFNDNNIPSAMISYRSAISIINISSAGIASGLQPILSDALIANNVCNSHQSIVVTSKKSISDGRMVYPGLMAIDCFISNNICGTIGYWISSGTKYTNFPTTYNVDKNNSRFTNLTIQNNTCYYIATQDEVGKYFVTSKRTGTYPGNSTTMCDYPSGFVTIKDNKSSWIHVGIAYEDDSKLSILDNHLCAYDATYIYQYNDRLAGLDSDENYGSAFAIFVNSNKHESAPTGSPLNSNDSCCIISGNMIGTGYWYHTGPTEVFLKYQRGGIFCKASNIITNNIVKGVAGSTNVCLIAFGGRTNIIKNNKLYREDNTIAKYIGFKNYENPSWDGSVDSSGIITNNYLDSPFIDGVSTDVFNTPVSSSTCSWIVEKNINQTVTRKMMPISARHENHYNAGMSTTGGIWALQPGWSTCRDSNTGSNYWILKFDASASSGNDYFYLFWYDMSAVLPPDVKIIQVSCLIHNDTWGASPTTYYMKLLMQSYNGAFEIQDEHYFNDSDHADYTLTVNPANPAYPFINFINGGLRTLIMLENKGTNDEVTHVYPLTIKYRW